MNAQFFNQNLTLPIPALRDWNIRTGSRDSGSWYWNSVNNGNMSCPVQWM